MEDVQRNAVTPSSVLVLHKKQGLATDDLKSTSEELSNDLFWGGGKALNSLSSLFPYISLYNINSMRCIT